MTMTFDEVTTMAGVHTTQSVEQLVSMYEATDPDVTASLRVFTNEAWMLVRLADPSSERVTEKVNTIEPVAARCEEPACSLVK